jgi:dTDP-6-deoxy-L-talose 4-dehydrogenase (NAD+)
MKKRILLTGATGFVGKQILHALLGTEVDLRLVIRRGTESRLAPCYISDLIYTDDLFAETCAWWSQACENVHTVIHAAWYAEPSHYMQSPKNLECLRGTLELALGGMQAGIARFVGVGSCAEYDMREGHLSTQTPLAPTTVYGGAKAATYLALSNCLPKQDIEFVWCRLFYLFGQGEHPARLIPYLHERLTAGQPVDLTSGKQIRDYLDVTIAGEKIAEISLGHACGAVNICSGQPQTVRELAEKIADSYGRRDLLRFGARPDNQFDPPCVVGIKS